jgi:hypothetical protein
MEPDRFDDVGFRILESPEPPPRPPRRRSRWALAAVAAVLTAGALAAGASALTDDAKAPTVAKPRLSHTAEGIPFVRDGHPCKAGEGHRNRAPDASSFDDSARY